MPRTKQTYRQRNAAAVAAPPTPEERYGATGVELRETVTKGLKNLKVVPRSLDGDQSFLQFEFLPDVCKRVVFEFAGVLFTLNSIARVSKAAKRILLGNATSLNTEARVIILRALFRLFGVTQRTARVVHKYVGWPKLVPILVDAGRRLYEAYHPMEPSPVHCWMLFDRAILHCFEPPEQNNFPKISFIGCGIFGPTYPYGMDEDNEPAPILSLELVAKSREVSGSDIVKIPNCVADMFHIIDRGEFTVLGDMKDAEWCNSFGCRFTTYDLLRTVHQFEQRLVQWRQRCRMAQRGAPNSAFLLRLPRKVKVTATKVKNYRDSDSEDYKIEYQTNRIPANATGVFQHTISGAFWEFWESGIPFLPQNVFCKVENVNGCSHSGNSNNINSWEMCTALESQVIAESFQDTSSLPNNAEVFCRVSPEDPTPFKVGEEVELAILLPDNWWDDKSIVGHLLVDEVVCDRVLKGGPSVLWLVLDTGAEEIDYGVCIGSDGVENIHCHSYYWDGGQEPWQSMSPDELELDFLNIAMLLLVHGASDTPLDGLCEVNTQSMVTFALHCRARGIGEFGELPLAWWKEKIQADDIRDPNERYNTSGFPRERNECQIARNLALLSETLAVVELEYLAPS